MPRLCTAQVCKIDLLQNKKQLVVQVGTVTVTFYGFVTIMASSSTL